ncbi:MAG TPA: hypothetical protein VFC58_05050 [Desulfosporosinus sp.]|nr:hypothetical protein [Desulfosporosinus sp.]
MSRETTNGTRKHILWVSLIMLLLFVSLIILKWWVMALGLLIITMINLFKVLGNPKEEKRTNSGNFSNRVMNKRAGELPINIVGTSIVAATYKDDSGMD